MYDLQLYGKSKEQPMPVINIKALLFSVSFESKTGLRVQVKHFKTRPSLLIEIVTCAYKASQVRGCDLRLMIGGEQTCSW